MNLSRNRKLLNPYINIFIFIKIVDAQANKSRIELVDAAFTSGEVSK